MCTCLFSTFIDQLHIVAATKCSSGALSTSKQPPSIRADCIGCLVGGNLSPNLQTITVPLRLTAITLRQLVNNCLLISKCRHFANTLQSVSVNPRKEAQLFCNRQLNSADCQLVAFVCSPAATMTRYVVEVSALHLWDSGSLRLNASS